MAFFKIEKKKKATKSFDCSDCGLHLKCQSPKMGVTGKGKEKILLIAEAPGQTEDEQGKQLVGTAGQYLYEECMDIGFDIHEDCWKINAINCRPPKNRAPTVKELKACSHMWQSAIKELKPEKIILLGKSAVEAFLMDRTTDVGGINKWIGHAIPDQYWGCWVFPIYHPSFIVRSKDDKVLQNRFYDDLVEAYDHNKPFPIDDPKVVIIKDLEEGIKLLEKINRNEPQLLSFDYETTGIKPHRKGHRIVTVSFCWDGETAYAMPFFNETIFFDLYRLILENQAIGKTAHNMKFEETWSRVRGGVKQVKHWAWDSMIASHVLDNRGGINSLKMQTYINFGVIGYEDEVKPYLEGVKQGEDEKSGNRFNKIDNAPIDKLLHYNALDSYYGFKLTRAQQAKIKKDRPLTRAYKLFHDGIISFVDMEETGWLADESYYSRAFRDIDRRDKKIVKTILQSEENKLYKEKHGTDINHKSTEQLRELFFEVLELEPVKKTDKGNASVDKEVLAALSGKSIIAKCLTDTRKNKGLKDRLKALQREAVDGIIHPSYNLHIARSYRSSCSNPNQQNNPKRDPESKRLVREGIIARPGHYILSRDFSGVEVSTACFYHKDPVMMKYCSDPSTDMHRDVAADLFFLDNDVVKENKSTVRYFAKNGFVFPQFYGDWWESCGEAIWEMMQGVELKDGRNLLQHMKSEKIKNVDDFKHHVKDIEHVFWKKRFKVYDKWKKEQWEDYQEKGYVEFLTGFRCTDILDRKQAVNRPIQGTAFHLLLWSLIEIQKVIKSWKSSIIGQIHDDLLFDVAPEELDDLMDLTDEIEKVKIRKRFPWINVPLDIESEISEIGGNWYKMEEFN